MVNYAASARKGTAVAFLFVVAAGCNTLRHTCRSTKFHVWRTFSATCPKMELKKSMKRWKFSDPKLTGLPMDSETENFVRRSVPKVVFSRVLPTPLKGRLQLAAFSSDAMRDILDMDPESMPDDPDFVAFVGGNLVLPGSDPLSHRYGGHQFGSWADQLGDGRAVLLGEYINRMGERWELQLKGSGMTPYSRFGDGRAVLRSSVREFLCSEAMHHLGIPTSRAAAVVVADDRVVRDIFYNGRPTMERCAVVLRLAPTWFRIGSLEILSRRAEIPELRRLADFVLENQFPDVSAAGPDSVLEMFSRVVEETAELMAKWTSVGFVHGVMNTDNLSLASITIDYGPFGFVDDYDSYYTPNHSDDEGRYSLTNQPDVAEWNLEMLAKSLKPLVQAEKHDQLATVLKGFQERYGRHHLNLFRKKLGLQNVDPQLDKGDEALVAEWMTCLRLSRSDFTLSFRDLSEIPDEDLFESKTIDKDSFWALHIVSQKAAPHFAKFLSLYEARLKLETGDRAELMKSSNPRYILRQWMAQRAIEKAENDDFSEVRLILKVLRQPFTLQPEAEAAGYAGPVPDWSRHLVLSCSS